MNHIRPSKSAYTLIEIMIVVAIIGLLAALAIPGFSRARRQSQGRRIVNDARQMDAAVDQWALETGQSDGNAILTTSAATYLKTSWSTTDLLSNPFTIGVVGSSGQISVSSLTKSALQGAGVAWGPY